MKKTLCIIALTLVIFTLASCNKKKNTRVEYLNDMDVAIYLFQEEPNEKYDLNYQYKINNLENNYEHAYTCIVFNINKVRNMLTADILNNTYALLLNNDKKMMVVFLDGENYSFMKGTSFANEKDYYENDSQINAYTNFYANIQSFSSSTNVDSYDALIFTIEQTIKKYVSTLN